MAEAATKIPVIWKTKESVADRLLGQAGRPLLDDLLARTQALAAKRRWPLIQVRVEHEEDWEVDWEYLVIGLEFDCPLIKAKRLFWGSYMKVIDEMYTSLEAKEKDVFAKMVCYEFDSGP